MEVQIPHGKGLFGRGDGATWPWAVQSHRTDRDAVWYAESGWPKEPCIRCGPDLPMDRGNFEGKGMPWHAQRHSAAICAKPKPSSVVGKKWQNGCAKMAESIEMPFALSTRVGRRKHVLHGGTLAQPDEYDWTVRVQRRCGLMSNYTLTTC